MPDQRPAPTGHALLQEITGPLGTLPDDPVPVAAEADFPVVLRGYDRIAVDAYVKKVSQLVAELQARRSPEAAVRRALERVGEEISGILQRAHESAEEMTRQSQREAEDRLEVARAEVAEITRAAETRVRELDVDADRIWAERERIVEDARELARQLLDIADSATARFPSADTTTEGEVAAAEREVAVTGDADRTDTATAPDDADADIVVEGDEDPRAARTAEERRDAQAAGGRSAATAAEVRPEADAEEPRAPEPDPEATAVLPRVTPRQGGPAR